MFDNLFQIIGRFGTASALMAILVGLVLFFSAADRHRLPPSGRARL